MSHATVDELATLLAKEQTTLDQLRAVLSKESDALLKNDINAVEGSAQHKKSLLARFKKQVQIRLDYLSAHGFESSEQGFESLINTLTPDPTSLLHTQWRELKTEFEAVIKQNEENGIVIHHSRNRTRALLNILHGNKNQPNLYNESGSDKGNRQRHTLGEA
jgi:flagellar biosynthesis/type III secretory pathway chaperone